MNNQGICKLVLSLICLVPVILQAQIELEVITNPEDVRIHHIGPEDGLITENIYDLHIDSYGFLWFTSDYGLGYYDGYSFRTFVYKEDDTTFCLTTLYIPYMKIKRVIYGHLPEGDSAGLTGEKKASGPSTRILKI